MAPSALVSVAAAVNKLAILEANLLRSPDLAGRELLVEEGFACAGKAYNAALDAAAHDVVVFAHQDVYFPAGWFSALDRAIEALRVQGARWGVLGCFGVSPGRPRGAGRIYSMGWGRIGVAIDAPEIVETLDEIVLVVRRSSGLRFDEALPHFHLYGTDICLAARARGLTVHAFQAYCVHNTHQLLALPAEFYSCYRYIKSKWRAQLPIVTPCITITRFDGEMRWRRLRERGDRLLRRTRHAVPRAPDPRPFALDEDVNAHDPSLRGAGA